MGEQIKGMFFLEGGGKGLSDLVFMNRKKERVFLFPWNKENKGRVFGHRVGHGEGYAEDHRESHWKGHWKGHRKGKKF